MLKMALVLGGMLTLAAPAQAQMNSADLKWGPRRPCSRLALRWQCRRAIPARQGRS